MEARNRAYKYLQKDTDFTTDETYAPPTVYFENLTTGERTYRTFHPYDVKRRILGRLAYQFKHYRLKGIEVTIGFLKDGKPMFATTNWTTFRKIFKSTWKQRI
jgi:hypothetical protein